MSISADRRRFHSADWALVAIVGLSSLAAAGRAVLFLRYPWAWIDGEAINTFFASRVARGEALYQDWTEGSLAFPIYPPGFFWTLALIQRFADQALWPGRLLSFAATAFTVCAAYRIARLLGTSRTEALIAALGLMTFGSVVITTAVVRPDALALALGAAALLLLTAWEAAQRTRTVALAAAACAAMIVTKPNYAPLAGVLTAFLLFRSRRAAVVFATTVVGVTTVCVWLAYATSGEAFLSNARDFNSVGYSLGALGATVKGQLLPVPHPMLVIGGIAASLAAWQWRSIRAVHVFWFGTLLVLASALKVGSAENYWAPTALASTILVALAMSSLRAEGLRARGWILAFLALSLAPATIRSVNDLRSTRVQMASASDLHTHVTSRIKATRGPVFLLAPDYALKAELRPAYDPFVFAMLAGSGRWDPEPLAVSIERRRFSLIQLSFDLYQRDVPAYHGVRIVPERILDAARSNYCVLDTPGSEALGLYRPCHSDETPNER